MSAFIATIKSSMDNLNVSLPNVKNKSQFLLSFQNQKLYFGWTK